MEEDENLTTRIVTEMFDGDYSIIVCRLKKLGKAWKLVEGILYKLPQSNKAIRVVVFAELSVRKEQIPFLKPLDLHCKKVMWCLVGLYFHRLFLHQTARLDHKSFRGSIFFLTVIEQNMAYMDVIFDAHSSSPKRGTSNGLNNLEMKTKV